MTGKINGTAIACIGAGSVLIWSGVKGQNLTRTVGELITGKAPVGPEEYMLAGASSSGSSTTSNAPSGPMPSGVITYEGKPVAAWIVPILKCAKSNGWTGSVNSGYRSAADQARVCATGVQPCAKPGTSHHQGTAYPDGAVDVSNAAQLSAILTSGKCNANGLVWAGAKDPVHFSVPSGGGY